MNTIDEKNKLSIRMTKLMIVMFSLTIIFIIWISCLTYKKATYQGYVPKNPIFLTSSNESLWNAEHPTDIGHMSADGTEYARPNHKKYNYVKDYVNLLVKGDCDNY